jgi:molecular chaperone HtpG
VKSSDRLVGSPALATNADKFASPMMRRMMKAMKKPGEADEPVKVNLEINPRHAVIKKLHAMRTTDADKAELVAEQLLDNALIAAGLLEDPSRMVARLNKLLESV